MKTPRLACLIIGVFLLVLALRVSFTLAAEEFPSKYITIVCGFTPGGSTDVQIRGIVPYVQKHLGKGIVVENRIGASGLIALNGVFSATPDGYTLVAETIPNITIMEKYFPENTKYEVRKFSHIFAFARGEVILLGHPETYKSFQELIEAGKQKKLKVGITGKGNPTHLGALTLERVAKIEINLIPFEGGAESLASLAGKHIDAVVTLTSSAISLSRSGMVRPLLIIGERRYPAFPDTPSAKELGYETSRMVPLLTGVLGPPGMSEDRLKILEAAFAKAVEEPEYVKWAKNMNIEILPLPSAAFLKETLRGYPMVEECMKILKK